MSQTIVSATNRTPVIQIVTWLCLITSTLAFTAHACIKIFSLRVCSAETLLGGLSLVFSAAQSVAVTIQAANGFGQPAESLSEAQVRASIKSGYAAEIFLMVAMGLSKMAMVAFIHGLTPRKVDRGFNYALGGFAVLWTASSVLVSAFQCGASQPWDLRSSACIDRFAWWYAVGILNIGSEVAIVALEVGMMVPLHITRLRKLSIISLFACRLFFPVAAAVQLHVFQQDSKGELRYDFMLGYWRSTICTQVMQCLAIVTTALPYAKLFMDTFDSGLVRVDDLRRRAEQTTGDGSAREYKLLEVSGSGQTSQAADGIRRTQTWTVERT
ncbi:hypothetical protein BDV95DRAFT_609459 [Massariosphaeria phaeospora]|uniref:Rhodopsin domain-containing protein n=1 Tax=Massariosphaeria phaeospora TaxID=100035 RepID=A0A7C8I6B9_9PLEO|nr:hypothetical protein BDV95DRAFT_609459 [Massariosphaeria phaeospora]